jgi:anti-sigma regulatory factor (Ser/Thr protein kinase)
MDDLSLHIMDIIENSVRAEATEVSLVIETSLKDNMLKIVIVDNGSGMDKEEIKRCEDPFYTTKECKKTGLGIALLKQSSEEANGTFMLLSEKGMGTKISATFQYDHIDRRPLGDIAKTMYIVIAAYPAVNFLFRYTKDAKSFEIDTGEIKEGLEDIPINAPDVLKTLRNHIIGGIQSVDR